VLTVDVVIPVHGHWELTERVLDSLATRDACVRRVVVVDDASPDDTAARLRARDDVDAVILTENVNFAGACNLGAARGDADAIFFLNNDTLVPPGSIARLAATCEESGAAAVGPLLLNADGSVQVAGLALLPGGSRFTRLHTGLDGDHPQAHVAYEPIALSGAAVLVRREAFRAVGGFDEAFVNDSEDVDLSLALWAHGYRCRYEPRATIVHLEGATRGGDTDRSANTERLRTRWNARLATMPRRHEPQGPVLDLRWKSATALERTVHDVMLAATVRYGGARVVDNVPLLAPLAATLDKRRLLAIDHRGTARGVDVAWCAPESAADALTLAAREARAYWVPSHAGARLLRDAGIAQDRLAVVRPGFPALPPPTQRARTHVAIVHRDSTPIAEIVAALDGRPYETIVVEHARAPDLARLRAAQLVVFADEADAWGVLGSAALSAGATAVIPQGSVVNELIDPGARIGVPADPRAIADAVRDALHDEATVAAIGAFAARDLARRGSDVHSARRVAELARAQVHGAADTLALTMPADAAHALREHVAG
jgi:GT2 family glycosyltransferase